MSPVASLSVENAIDFLNADRRKSLLRLVTCGSVDDGKSTLIGRLLLATGSIFDDQIASLAADTQRYGTTDAELDPALLLDGLEDERRQGITIDVAYRYFQTARRKFIVADSPGHEQYTRNMATAASNADVAVILVDARKGLLPQTKRHSFIVALLGVRHVVLAVSKIDTVGYDEAAFRQISEEYLGFSRKLEFAGVRCIPVSGLRGDNVAMPSDATPWYGGETLLQALETVETEVELADAPLRFPVQRVVRPDPSFRGYAGTLASGRLRVGDVVTALPSGRSSRVRSLVTFDGELSEVSAPSTITVTLEDELDVARGDMIVHPETLPRTGRTVEASLVWFSEEALVPGRPYWLKQTSRRTTAEVTTVFGRIDVEALRRVESAALRMNDVGRCRIELNDPIAYDDYRTNRKTGSFILVDRVTHETVAAGMIGPALPGVFEVDRWSEASQGIALAPAVSRISAADRQSRYGHPAVTILITGLTGSGKTAIATALEERLFRRGTAVALLDGQNLRLGISRDLGFSAEERSENLRRAAEIARILNDAGMVCIAAFVAPSESVREKAKQVVGPSRVLHVHLEASEEVCRSRDRCGRYDAADRGEIAEFPGVTASYDAPQRCDLRLRTDELDVESCVVAIESLVEMSIDRTVESANRQEGSR